MKIILKSGREVDYERPNYTKRLEILDGAMKSNVQGIPMSLNDCAKIILYCKIGTAEQLENDEFTFNEMFEIGGHIVNEIFEAQADKKK